MENNFLPRIGTFLIVIGLGLLILFIGSVFSSATQISYFLLSAAAFFLGTVLRRRAMHQPSGRFGGINRIRGRNRKDPEDK